ncbi:MAG TPA: hypothetical protein VFR14_06485 [Candidatus Limnocylindrales bacterium]|nr:hypothetical protein [Candidatus Limnocylindrales bacterium]
MRTSPTRHRPLPTWLALVISLVLVAACGASAAPAASPIPVAPTEVSDDVRGEASPAAAASPRAPSASAAPAIPSPSPAPPTPQPEPFALNLYREGDFIGQYTFEWCVGASVQMTLNILRPEDDRSRLTQQRLWERARDLSDSPFGGANPVGWVPLLNELGIGDWRLVSVPTLEEAVRQAAAAIRATNRPVNLVMWRGRHAWVMSGFTSLGDPAATDAFEVTGVHVLDPLYPHGSTLWGASPEPNSLLTPAELGEQFVARTGGRIDLGVPPGYLLILPVG